MVAPATLTWDATPPTRPSLSDVGDAALVDHATRPPKAPTMPYAAMLNQWAMQIARLAGIVPVAVFSVRFSAGAPFLYKAPAMPSAPALATFTVTDNGTGDTTITWPAGTFPTSVAEPEVTINADLFAVGRAFLVANGVQVKTRSLVDAGVDAAFTVRVS